MAKLIELLGTAVTWRAHLTGKGDGRCPCGCWKEQSDGTDADGEAAPPR